MEVTNSQNSMMETPMYAIPELHFGKYLDPDDFQCWRVNFKTEACVSTSTRQLTMSWINEVDISGSVDDLMSQSIEGESFLDIEMFGARIASVLKKSSPVWESSELRKTTDSWEEHKCSFDLWPLSSNQSVWCSSRPVGLDQYLLLEWFRYKMGSDLVRNKWDASVESPQRFVQKQIERFWTTSESIFDVQPTVESGSRDAELSRLRKMARQHLTNPSGRALSKPGMKEFRQEYWSRVKKAETSARKEKESERSLLKRWLLQFLPRVSFWPTGTIILFYFAGAPTLTDGRKPCILRSPRGVSLSRIERQKTV